MEYSLDTYLDHEAGDHNLSLGLSVRCAACSGRGKIAHFADETFVPCAPCGATGFRLTYNGLDLLRFVREFSGHPDAAATDYEELQP